MSYDAQRGVTVLFGGIGYSGEDLTTTWEWNGQSWTARAASGPPARFRHAMSYDPQRRVTVLTGGYSSVPFPGASRLDDTWEWDGVAWTERPLAGGAARNGHALAWDGSRGVMCVFGGNGTAYDIENELSELLPPAGDADEDGVPDLCDQCPASRPGATVDEDGCGVFSPPAPGRIQED